MASSDSKRSRPESGAEPPPDLDAIILDALPTSVCVCEARSGAVIRYNRRAADLWGREPGEEAFSGALHLFRVDGTPLPHRASPMAEVLRSGEAVVDVPLLIERPDGTRRAILVQVEPVRDEAGRVIAAIETAQDVTDRWCTDATRSQQHADLDTERRRLADLFERSPALLAVLTGPDHVIERVNEQFVELVGQRDILGKPVREALPEVAAQGFFEALDRVYAKGEPHVRTGARVLLDREPGEPPAERFLEFIYHPLQDAAGNVAAIIAVGIDLSARRQAAADLEAISAASERWRRLHDAVLSTTPDLVYVFGVDHRFTYVNQALLAMWGRTYEDAVGKTCRELGYEPWHAELHDREIDRVIRTRRPIRGEVPFTGTGGRRIYEYIFVPVFGANGEVEAVAGTTRDVTERKELEEELQRRAEALEQADRNKDDFIAVLAHELRNPLAPLRTGLQVMRLADTDAAIVERTRAMMDRQLDHMVRLIDDLMDVSRMTRHKLRLEPERVLLTEVVASAIETVRPAIEAAGHELSVSLPAEPVALDADLTRLAQVFSNLLANSARYTDRGGRIRVIAETQDDELLVSVRDNGIGIPKEALSTIFDVFSQLERTPERPTQGLGIGLALVKGIVEMHGGSVSASSAGAGEGSTFTVRLPLGLERPESPVVACTPAAPLRNRRILVADDNRDAAEALAVMLRLLDNDVRVAHDGLEAVEVAEAFDPEIILMDLGMPRLDGLEATRRVRARPGGARAIVIALTGWGQGGDRVRSAEAGCDGHLVKPVEAAALFEALVAAQRGARCRIPHATDDAYRPAARAVVG